MALPRYAKIRFVCKCIELVLACVCMGLYANSYMVNYQLSAPILLPLTYGGFIIIQVGLILGYATTDRIPKRIDLLYTFTGIALFLAAGSIGINYFRPRAPQDSPTELLYATGAYIRTGLATGSVAICNSAVFLVDLLLSYKDVNDAYIEH